MLGVCCVQSMLFSECVVFIVCCVQSMLFSEYVTFEIIYNFLKIQVSEFCS